MNHKWVAPILVLFLLGVILAADALSYYRTTSYPSGISAIYFHTSAPQNKTQATTPLVVHELKVHLFKNSTPQVVLVYQLPTEKNSPFAKYAIEVSSMRRNGTKKALFKEKGADPGGEIELTKLKTTHHKEAVVVIEHLSAADGGNSGWHLITAKDGKIVRIDRAALLQRAFRRRGYKIRKSYAYPYSRADVKANEVVESVPLDPFDRSGNEPILEIRYRFNGKYLQLISAKNIR